MKTIAPETRHQQRRVGGNCRPNEQLQEQLHRRPQRPPSAHARCTIANPRRDGVGLGS